jgi:DNA-binding transcriptional MerR regulator
VKARRKLQVERDDASQAKKTRNQRLTNPPTYTSGEVAKILKNKVTSVSLERWDDSGVFRPSHYWANEKLLSREERDDSVRAKPSDKSSRGNPERRYTYHDLVWLRLLIYVKEYYEELGTIRRSGAKSAAIIKAIQKTNPERCPAATRLFFLQNGDAYLVRDDGTAERLSDDRQLAMRIILTDKVAADVDGRISALEANLNLRAIFIEDRKSFPERSTSIAGV